MTYILLNVIFLLALSAVVFVLFNKSLNTVSRKNLVYSLLTVLLLTAFFDSLIVRTGIVAYETEKILGIYIWKAPVEDFAYAIASVLMTSLLWEYYDKKRS